MRGSAKFRGEPPLRSSEGTPPFGTLALDARRDGQGYSKRDRARLERAARVVAQAVLNHDAANAQTLLTPDKVAGLKVFYL